MEMVEIYGPIILKFNDKYIFDVGKIFYEDTLIFQGDYINYKKTIILKEGILNDNIKIINEVIEWDLRNMS